MSEFGAGFLGWGGVRWGVRVCACAGEERESANTGILRCAQNDGVGGTALAGMTVLVGVVLGGVKPVGVVRL